MNEGLDSLISLMLIYIHSHLTHNQLGMQINRVLGRIMNTLRRFLDHGHTTIELSTLKRDLFSEQVGLLVDELLDNGYGVVERYESFSGNNYVYLHICRHIFGHDPFIRTYTLTDDLSSTTKNINNELSMSGFLLHVSESTYNHLKKKDA